MADSPYKIIDEILELYLVKDVHGIVDLSDMRSYSVKSFTQIEIAKLLKVETLDEYNMDKFELIYTALRKLKKEKYLYTSNIKYITSSGSEYTEPAYYLTFEGRLLIFSGGYAEMMRQETRDANRKDFYERVTSYAAGLGGLYVFFQIVESFLKSWAYWKIVSSHF